MVIDPRGQNRQRASVKTYRQHSGLGTVGLEREGTGNTGEHEKEGTGKCGKGSLCWGVFVDSWPHQAAQCSGDPLLPGATRCDGPDGFAGEKPASQR